jgi:hypothetical protein
MMMAQFRRYTRRKLRKSMDRAPNSMAYEQMFAVKMLLANVDQLCGALGVDKFTKPSPSASVNS